MFLNETIELSFDDYETYVEPILTESHTDISEYCSIFGKKCSEENESISRKELYSLFGLVCSLYLNGDMGRPSDIPKNHQDFLQAILKKIINPLVQARVADILWMIQEKNKKENAEIALKSYMLFIENNLSNQKLVIEIVKYDYSQRVLFLSNWTKNKENHQEIIKKFENLIQSREKISSFFIKKIILLLIEEKESNKNLCSIFEEEIKDSDSLNDWEDLEKVYSKLNKSHKVNECKIRQGEIWAQHGDYADDSINKMFCYKAALDVYPNTKETKTRIKEINAKLSIALSSLKERSYHKVPLLQADLDYIKKKSMEIKEKISGLSFLEALKALISYLEYPSVEKLKQESEMERSNPLGLFSPAINSFRVTNVNLQSRCESQNLDDSERDLIGYFAQRYFCCYKIITLPPVMEGLKIIRKEHSNIKEDDWIIILEESFIPKERLESFSIGFYNWFYKRNLVALPILIPQFENLIRYLLQDSQNDTAVYRNKERKQEEESFKNNFNNEIIENKLGQDLVFQFKALLFADKGLNLRNKIEHGLVDDLAFSDLESDYLVLLMLKVVLFCISKDAS